MPVTPTMWRFDSVDLGAGVGFASLRPSIRVDDDTALFQNATRPMLHCAAPDFALVPITNPALAHRAARGGGEFGTLFSGTREHGFESAEALRSFLRRAYARRNSGGGGGEGEGPPAPPFGDGGGEPELPSRAGKSEQSLDEPVHSRLAQAIGDFAAETELATPTLARAYDWHSVSTLEADTSLEKGAAHVFIELMRIFPHNGDTRQLLQWQQSIRALGEVIGRLELIERLARDPSFDIMRQAIATITLDHFGFTTNGSDTKHTIYMLLFSDMSIDGFLYIEHPSAWASLQNKLEVLQRLPMPSCALEQAQRRAGRIPTLFHLVTSFCADPTCVMAAGDDSRILDSVLLAVTFLCSVDDRTPQTYSPYLSNYDTPMGAMRRKLRFEAAMKWLAHQLPDRAFHPEIEAIIKG